MAGAGFGELMERIGESQYDTALRYRQRYVLHALQGKVISF